LSDLEFRFQEAIKEVRDTLQADKADLLVDSVAGDAANVSIVISDEACADCILPKDLLAEMLLMVTQEHCPEIRNIEVYDPRDHGFVSHGQH
jgi:hypothetical protein